MELADVIQAPSSLRALQFLHHGRHLMQLSRELAVTLGSLGHPLLHHLHEPQLRVLQPQQSRITLMAPQLLPKTHRPTARQPRGKQRLLKGSPEHVNTVTMKASLYSHHWILDSDWSDYVGYITAALTAIPAAIQITVLY